MTSSTARRELFSLAAGAALAGGGVLLAGCGSEVRARAMVSAGTPTASPSFLPPTVAVAPSPTRPPTLTEAPSSTMPPASVAATPLAVATIAGPFGTAVPATWVALMPAVREYCYYLKRAIVAGNVGVLWQRYPALQQGASATTGSGTNVESFYVDQYRQLHPFDGDISPESYAPIKVKLAGDRAEVLVHGSASYLRLSYDNAGKQFFDMSSAEFVVQLFLQRGAGTWTVVQTEWPGMRAYTGQMGPPGCRNV